MIDNKFSVRHLVIVDYVRRWCSSFQGNISTIYILWLEFSIRPHPREGKKHPETIDFVKTTLSTSDNWLYTKHDIEIKKF